MLVDSAAAAPRMSLEQWRAAANQTRALAENDVPKAYAEAVRLKAALPADASPVYQARALNLLARTEVYSGLTAQADAHARQALALARLSGDHIGQAQADLNMTLTSVNLGRIDELRAAATDAVAVLNGVDDPALTGEALLRAAMMYLRLGRINHAVMTSVRASDIARRNRNPLALTYAAQGLGIAFGQSGRSAGSRRYFEEMLTHARAAHSRLLEGDATKALADAYDSAGQTARSQLLYRQAIALYTQAGAPLSINLGLLGLANFMHEHGYYRRAAPLLDRVIANYERHPTPIGLWYALNTRSANEQSLRELPAAQADAQRAYGLAKQIGLPGYISSSARRLGELAAAAGDFRRAYRLSVAASAIAAHTVGKSRGDQVLELASQYERESRQREIETLTRRDQAQAAALRQRGLKERLLLTMLLGAIAIAIITGFFVLRFRRLNATLERRVQERTAELRQQTRYLRTLIGEREAAEAAREAALAEARRLARLRSDFMAQMSHELRTPLNGILGYTALLERDAGLREPQRASLEVIRQSGEHLLGLINEVLDFARIESGKLELETSTLALGPSLRSIAGVVSVRAQLKGLAFSLKISPEVPGTLLADERRLRQVLLNLLANAITFTDRGSVRLEVCCPMPQRLRFEVADTGTGIRADQLETIFQPFEQVADGQHRGGTGLGLPISRRYVQLMGSDIEVESRVGAGSTFRFDLAIQPAAAPADGANTVADGAAVHADMQPVMAEEGDVSPPPAQIERLHALALEGNMRDILRWARQLADLEGERYRRFALHVRFLAERYQSQAILSLAKRHLGGQADG
jgi:signal transduction histidine kinase